MSDRDLVRVVWAPVGRAGLRIDGITYDGRALDPHRRPSRDGTAGRWPVFVHADSVDLVLVLHVDAPPRRTWPARTVDDIAAELSIDWKPGSPLPPRWRQVPLAPAFPAVRIPWSRNKTWRHKNSAAQHTAITNATHRAGRQAG